MIKDKSSGRSYRRIDILSMSLKCTIKYFCWQKKYNTLCYTRAMGIIKKRVGNGEYAYWAVREGKRVYHKYLGPLDSPRVRQRIAEQKEVSMVPKRFRSLFWDTELDNIRIKEHARYIIERILELGDLDAVSWLQKVYPVQVILDALAASRTVSAKSRNFWEIWFEVTHA